MVHWCSGAPTCLGFQTPKLLWLLHLAMENIRCTTNQFFPRPSNIDFFVSFKIYQLFIKLESLGKAAIQIASIVFLKTYKIRGLNIWFCYCHFLSKATGYIHDPTRKLNSVYWRWYFSANILKLMQAKSIERNSGIYLGPQHVLLRTLALHLLLKKGNYCSHAEKLYLYVSASFLFHQSPACLWATYRW